MIFGKKLALLGTSALFGTLFVGSRQFHAAAITRSNRVYTSIRNEYELNQLLILPNPLLANFCMLTDVKSQSVSSVLEKLVKANDSAVPLSSVDVEIDEPGNAELMQRYLITNIPTIVHLEGGQLISRLVPKGETEEELNEEIREFIGGIGK